MQRSTGSEQIVVIGGGASGVLAAVSLMGRASARHSIDIRLVERAATVGPGLAYGAADPHHLLNNVAGRMSALDHDDGHFVRWCTGQRLAVRADTFVPRAVYGRYLASVFAGLADLGHARLRVVTGEATQVYETAAGVRVKLDDGDVLDADRVVLALGNPPPKPSRPEGAANYVADPWAPGALDRIDGRSRVLMIGSGLTMIDVATSLARRHSEIDLTTTSRHLLLPREHPADAPPLGLGVPDHLHGLREIASHVIGQLRRAERNGESWQAIVDGVRPQIGRIWGGLSLDERRRFARHLSRRWEVHRHRMAPQVHDEIESLRARGTLRLAKDVDVRAYDAVVNCTGPQSVCAPGWSPLVDNLLGSGVARPDPLGLGLDVDEVGALRTSRGVASDRLFVLGVARRGTNWECGSVPEIRRHATDLSDAILGSETSIASIA